jgi:hypothetical protein
MIRIPRSYNSKYPEGKNEVKIMQKWDGYRPPINLLLETLGTPIISAMKARLEKARRISKADDFPSNNPVYRFQF